MANFVTAMIGVHAMGVSRKPPGAFS